VVLAAGASTRLGRPKQLVMHEGLPLVRRAAIAAADAGAAPVLVVLGADADEIAPALAGLQSVSVVMNADWHTGLASSLAAGLRALGTIDSEAEFDAEFDAGYDAVLVTLADQPLVDAAALRRVLVAFTHQQRIVAAEYDGVIGVPAIFAREHLADLLRLTGDAGAGSWLRRHAGDVTRVRLDAAALDVDTERDVARLQRD